ncbi:17305_t:CDS:2, partial [Funneliformis caledonium]
EHSSENTFNNVDFKNSLRSAFKCKQSEQSSSIQKMENEFSDYQENTKSLYRKKTFLFCLQLSRFVMISNYQKFWDHEHIKLDANLDPIDINIISIWNW